MDAYCISISRLLCKKSLCKAALWCVIDSAALLLCTCALCCTVMRGSILVFVCSRVLLEQVLYKFVLRQLIVEHFDLFGAVKAYAHGIGNVLAISRVA